MSIDSVIGLVDAAAVPLCLALFAVGAVTAIASSLRSPVLPLRSLKLMAAPVFLLPVLSELRWLAQSPFSPSDDFVLWLISTVLSVALVVGMAAALVWLVRLKRPDSA